MRGKSNVPLEHLFQGTCRHFSYRHNISAYLCSPQVLLLRHLLYHNFFAQFHKAVTEYSNCCANTQIWRKSTEVAGQIWKRVLETQNSSTADFHISRSDEDVKSLNAGSTCGTRGPSIWKVRRKEKVLIPEECCPAAGQLRQEYRNYY